MATKTKPPRVCRWEAKPDPDGHGLLFIMGAVYALRVLTDRGELAGYRLVNLYSERVYDLCPVEGSDLLSCDCPDAIWRRHSCKHARALRAALAVLYAK